MSSPDTVHTLTPLNICCKTLKLTPPPFPNLAREPGRNGQILIHHIVKNMHSHCETDVLTAIAARCGSTDQEEFFMFKNNNNCDYTKVWHS